MKWTPEADEGLLRIAAQSTNLGHKRIQWAKFLNQEPALQARLAGLAHPGAALEYRHKMLRSRGSQPDRRTKVRWTPEADQALLRIAKENRHRQRIEWRLVLRSEPALARAVELLAPSRQNHAIHARLNSLIRNGAAHPQPTAGAGAAADVPSYADGCPHCPKCGTQLAAWNRAYNAMMNQAQ